MGDAKGSGVGVWVAVGVSVGGGTTKTDGSTPGGIVITPGVEPLGGVTMIIASTDSEVGVNVGANVRVGAAVDTGCCTRLAVEQPSVTIRKAASGIRIRLAERC